MNTCFDNIVSLKEYCTPETPKSDIYLNDIGLNRTEIEQIITGDYDTVKELVNSTIAISVKEIAAELYGHFSNKIKVHSAVETGNTGIPATNKTLVTGGDYRGIKLQLHNGGNYLNFQLAAVSLFLDFSGDVDVLVYDLSQNKLLDTITVTAVSGQIVEVYPAKIYGSYLQPLSIWVGYDASAISSFKTLTRSSVCCGSYGKTTGYLKAHGATVTGDFIESNLEYINDTAGVGVRYSIYCDPYSWMCTYSRLLALPIAYKTASEIYRRGMMVSPNTRSNNSTIVNTDLLEKNFLWHDDKYKQSMADIKKGVHLPKSSVCFACDPVTQNKIILP